MARSETTKTTTTVKYVGKPRGRARENGPHLADLRAFVAECEGLPDDLKVRISNGHMGESGRYDVTIEATWSRDFVDGEPAPEEAVEEEKSTPIPMPSRFFCTCGHPGAGCYCR